MWLSMFASRNSNNNTVFFDSELSFNFSMNVTAQSVQEILDTRNTSSFMMSISSVSGIFSKYV